MPLVSPSTLEQIRAANDIVDVIGSYVPLKRNGANFVCLCPFHREKSPSFNVNPSRQIFRCFGCGKGGDVFSFVKEYESLDFMEAVRRLAERGFVAVYPNWAAVRARFGQVVVSKMAAIVKEKPDGSTKLRIIIDMRSSQVNSCVRLHERIVPPRILDLVSDALAITGFEEVINLPGPSRFADDATYYRARALMRTGQGAAASAALRAASASAASVAITHL